MSNATAPLDVVGHALLRMLLNDTFIRQHVLAQPALSDAFIQHALLISALDCASVHHQLALYLDAEQLGTATHAMYDQLVRHLHHCPVCFELYRAATDITAAQAAGILPPWPHLPIQPDSEPPLS